MIEGKTKSGIEFKIDERIREDWRFQKKLTKLIGFKSKLDGENTAPEVLAGITNTITELEELVFGGAEGAEAFEDVVAQTYGGTCSVTEFEKEFLEIISATSESKNS